MRTISLSRETPRMKSSGHPNDHHQAANRGDVPVVIFTATLLKKGFPAAIPD